MKINKKLIPMAMLIAILGMGAVGCTEAEKAGVCISGSQYPCATVWKI